MHGVQNLYVTQLLYTQRGARGGGGVGLEAPLRDRCRPPGTSDEGWGFWMPRGCFHLSGGTQVERAGGPGEGRG